MHKTRKEKKDKNATEMSPSDTVATLLCLHLKVWNFLWNQWFTWTHTSVLTKQFQGVSDSRNGVLCEPRRNDFDIDMAVGVLACFWYGTRAWSVFRMRVSFFQRGPRWVTSTKRKQSIKISIHVITLHIFVSWFTSHEPQYQLCSFSARYKLNVTNVKPV